MNNIQFNIAKCILFFMLLLTGCSSPQILEKAEDEVLMPGENPVPESASVSESSVAAEENAKNQVTAEVSVAIGDSKNTQTNAADEPDTDFENQTAAVCYVHISGAVKYPGVYQMQPQARLYEAVMKAGGFLETASEDYCNLAQTIEDGRKYYIPTKDEVKEMVGSDNGLYLSRETAVGSADGAASQSEAMSESAAEDVENGCYDNEGRLDINKAGVAELTLLQGIGNARAEAILAYRAENGPFQVIEDLMKVSGIKEGTYHQLKDKIVVR